MNVITGRTWVFGDGIDTDIIIPARYLVLPLDQMKWKAMEPVRADFAESVASGDIVVGGRNFGCGSSREQAPAVLKALGVRAIVAESFARIFYRNAINLGLPVVECPGIAAATTEGETISVDATEGEVLVESSGRRLAGSKLPEFLMEIISDGGLIEHLLARSGSTP